MRATCNQRSVQDSQSAQGTEEGVEGRRHGRSVPRPACDGVLSCNKPRHCEPVPPLRHCEPEGRGNPAGAGYSGSMDCRVAALLAMTRCGEAVRWPAETRNARTTPPSLRARRARQPSGCRLLRAHGLPRRCAPRNDEVWRGGEMASGDSQCPYHPSVIASPKGVAIQWVPATPGLWIATSLGSSQ